MSSTATTRKPSTWSDQEKVQLLTSIIAASGGPEWHKVNLPVGRTLSACKQLYYAIMRDKNLVLNQGSVEKKAGRASKQTAASTPSKRGRNMPEEQLYGNGSDDEESVNKKQRKAKDSDSEDEVDKIKIEDD